MTSSANSSSTGIAAGGAGANIGYMNYDSLAAVAARGAGEVMAGNGGGLGRTTQVSTNASGVGDGNLAMNSYHMSCL